MEGEEEGKPGGTETYSAIFRKLPSVMAFLHFQQGSTGFAMLDAT